MSRNQFMRGPEKKVKKRRRRGLEYLYLLLGASFLVAVMLAVVAKQNALRNTGYKITQLREETILLEEENRRLRSDLATLTRPDRVWQEALNQGLRPLDQESRISVHLLEDDQASENMVASKEP